MTSDAGSATATSAPNPPATGPVAGNPVHTVPGGTATGSSAPAPAAAGPTATGSAPTGPAGLWSMVFDDEFNGTGLDTTKWSPNWYRDGGVQNDVPTYASNVQVTGGNLVLTLAGTDSGASVNTNPDSVQNGPGFSLGVGNYVEARISFPGDGTDIYNWPAWWASGPNWPSSGEHDIAEGLDQLTVNYHSPSGAHNQGVIPGVWSNQFHTYGLYRGNGYADVYWDGQKVKTYSTDDNSGGQGLILNVGRGGRTVTGAASAVKVDWVRAYQPAG